jgi:NitT/TauT family transport system substrate-binding protein
MRLTGTRGSRSSWLLVALLGWSLLAAACGSGGDGRDDTSAAPETTAGGSAPSGDPFAPRPLDEPYTIRMTAPVRIEAFAQPMLADLLGELERENLTLEVEDTPTSEALALLESGRTDAHVSSPVAGFFNAVDQGLNVRFVAGSNRFGPDSPTGLYLRPELFESDGSVDPESLEGARIALGPNGWGDLAAGFFREWLLDNDLSTDDIDIQSFNSVDAMSQLENGDLDGAVLADPLYQQAVDQDFGRLFLSFPEDSVFNGYFAGPNLLEENREAGEAFFRAIGRTTQAHLQGAYHDDRSVAEAIAESIDAPIEDVRATEELVFDPTLAFDPAWVDQVQEAWLEIGDILAYDEPIPTDEWVDTSLIEPLAG